MQGALQMIQCKDCEHFNRGSGGQMGFTCDPFATIKEAECLAKWQLLRTSELLQRIDRLVTAYEATLSIYKKLEPLQEKMFRHMEREIDEVEEADAWKFDQDDEDAGGDADRDDDQEEDRPPTGGKPWA
jgi:hypothetical protein